MIQLRSIAIFEATKNVHWRTTLNVYAANFIVPTTFKSTVDIINNLALRVPSKSHARINQKHKKKREQGEISPLSSGSSPSYINPLLLYHHFFSYFHHGFYTHIHNRVLYNTAVLSVAKIICERNISYCQRYFSTLQCLRCEKEESFFSKGDSKNQEGNCTRPQVTPPAASWHPWPPSKEVQGTRRFASFGVPLIIIQTLPKMCSLASSVDRVVLIKNWVSRWTSAFQVGLCQPVCS